MTLSITRRDRVPDVPEERIKNCVYLTKLPGANEFDIYVVDGNGNVHSNFNEDRFRTLFNQYSQNLNVLFVVETIEARDLLVLNQNSLVYVADATGDNGITRGYAFYFYVKALNRFTLLLKEDVPPPRWEDMVGRPESSPEQIDNAVLLAHNHENKSTLDNLANVNNELHFRGAPVATVHFRGGNFTSEADPA